MILNLLLSSSVLIFLLIFGHQFSKRGINDLSAVQASHDRLTNRFGGVAIVCGISTILFHNNPWDNSTLILISGVPIFIGGLLEDITGKVKPRLRLVAALSSAGLAIWFLGVFIKSGDFWFLNDIFLFSIIAIPITLLISAGIVNAFNIIDGVNGFSAGYGLITALVLGSICNLYNEPKLSFFCYMIAIAILPFLIVNFPFGYIFLGDAGAYAIGHLLIWIAMVLLFRHPEISSWAMLLMFFWPASEVALSIYRRLMSRTPSGAPDSFHFHQLIKQFLELFFVKSNWIVRWANPLSTLVLLPFASIPIFIGFFALHSNFLAIIFYIILVAAYLVLYVFLIKVVRIMAMNSGNIELVDRLNYIFTPRNN